VLLFIGYFYSGMTSSGCPEVFGEVCAGKGECMLGNSTAPSFCLCEDPNVWGSQTDFVRNSFGACQVHLPSLYFLWALDLFMSCVGFAMCAVVLYRVFYFYRGRLGLFFYVQCFFGANIALASCRLSDLRNRTIGTNVLCTVLFLVDIFFMHCSFAMFMTMFLRTIFRFKTSSVEARRSCYYSTHPTALFFGQYLVLYLIAFGAGLYALLGQGEPHHMHYAAILLSLTLCLFIILTLGHLLIIRRVITVC